MRQIFNAITIVTMILTFSSYTIIRGEKILFFFGGGSYSHKHSVWPWTTALAERGHNVIFISAHAKSPSNHPNISDLASPTLSKLMNQSYDVDRFQQRERGQGQNILTNYSKLSADICEHVILRSENDPILQKLLHNETFDLVIINIIFGECGYIFAHRYGAKTILFDASVPLSWFYDVFGYQADHAWIPDVIMKYENIPMSFFDRMKNTMWPAYVYWNRYTVMYPEFDRIIKQAFHPHKIPAFRELEQNVSLVMVNSHHSFDFAYSLPPCVVQVGGMNAYLPEKPIPEKYLKFMDGAGSAGVVLISFGSTVNLQKVDPYYGNIFFQVIKKHKNVRFILKWNGPYPNGYENGLDNLLSDVWLPQRELLRHPNLKTFVTHGGLNSIQEATFYGLPMIVMPLFADQDYNAYRIEAQQVGFRIEIQELTFQVMDEALQKILWNKTYQKNMAVKAQIFRDRPQSPLETAVYWTEFVLRNDDVTSLRPMISHLNWYQRRSLDVYVVYGLILALPLCILGIVLLVIIRRVCILRKARVPSKKKSI